MHGAKKTQKSILTWAL